MQANHLFYVFLTGLLLSASASAQEKSADNSIIPGGEPDAPLGEAFVLPGQTCSGAGGTNCSVALPDLGQASSSFNFSGCGGIVTDANLGIDMTHTFVGDLVFTLRAPDGIETTVFDRPGVPATTFGCSGDDIQAVLDDQAAFPVEDQCAGGVPTISGTYTPNNPLSAFSGGPGDGTWTLTVSDQAGIDAGTLNNWSLELTCETQSRATFTVVKDFTDDNPGGVEVTLSCNTGLPLQQSKVITEAAGVEFVVTDFDDGDLNCTVTEDTTAGYDPEYFDGVTTNTSGCDFVDMTFGSCLVTNTPAPVTVTVNKEWVIPNSSNDVDQDWEVALFCDGEFAGAGGGDGDGSVEFEVMPVFGGSTCSVTEIDVADSFIEIDNGCQDIEIDIGQGAECTIVNTVFFEGIPTLDRWGLAVLVISVLGLGIMGYRRFA